MPQTAWMQSEASQLWVFRAAKKRSGSVVLNCGTGSCCYRQQVSAHTAASRRVCRCSSSCKQQWYCCRGWCKTRGSAVEFSTPSCPTP
jgi:hypothetical protein